MTDAYHGDSALEAEAALLALAKELDRTHPGATTTGCTPGWPTSTPATSKPSSPKPPDCP